MRGIRHCLKEHKKLDARKPAEKSRKQQLDQAAKTLEKVFDKIDQFLKTASPRMGQGKKPKEVKSNITVNHSANTREGHGRQVSFTRTNGRTPTDWMKRRIDSPEGKAIYGHRMSTVEPVFANIGTNKGLNPFSLRGKRKVQGQWRLYCLVHNIEKLSHYGNVA